VVSDPRPRDDRDAAQDLVRDLAEIAAHIVQLLISAEIAKRSLVGSAYGQLTFKRSHRLARGKAS